MNTASQRFTIDDAFELSPEDGEPGSHFGSLAFDTKSTVVRGPSPEQGERESSLRYQNLKNEDGLETNRSPAMSTLKIRSDLGRCSAESSRWSFSNISNTTQQSYRDCLSWVRHPLIQKNRKMVIACFILLAVGLLLVLIGFGLQVHPVPGVSSAIFFVPGFLILIPGVYHVIFLCCALKGRTGYRFFYLPYFEK